MSQVTLVEFDPAENKKERKRFIELAWKVNAKDPAWVPPLRLSVEENLDTKKNPFYQHSRIRLWNAYRDGEHVGRIAAVVNGSHNEFHKEKTGFWGFFEAVEDTEVAGKLFSAAESWLKKEGMVASRGPASPSTNHEVGLLINNFERDPYVMMTQNPAYYVELVENNGYAKVKDLYAFEMPTPDRFDERVARIAAKVKKKGNIEIRPINMKNFKKEVRVIHEIYNSAWEKNWGFVPMSEAEFTHMAKSLKDVLWPEFCMMAYVEGKPIGFSLSLPDIHQLQKQIPNGKLLPFGIFKLLANLKKRGKVINRVRVITLGVRPEWRASGVASVFYYETYARCAELGLFGGELSWILEDNRDMLSAIEAFAKVPPYKTYRVYEKALT